MDVRLILSFLYFGYLPDLENGKELLPPLFDWTRLPMRDDDDKRSESDLIDQGVEALKGGFRDHQGELHVVPLSGGLDSRAVLAGLLKAGLRDRIVAVTYGIPGTFDYEIPLQVAQAAGVRLERIDLSGKRIDPDELTQIARERAGWTFLFDAYYNSLATKRFGSGAVYWSGFMGGELGGAHVPFSPSASWGDAVRHFVAHERFIPAVTLTAPEFLPDDVLPSAPLIDQKKLSFDDQLDFMVRQRNYIQRVVIVHGFDYRAPFLYPEWVNFIMTVPRQYRAGQYLYRKILQTAYPDLFAIPTAKTYGLPLRASRVRKEFRRVVMGTHRRMEKYFPGNPLGVITRPLWDALGVSRIRKSIDFDREVRAGGGLHNLIGEFTKSLSRRGVIDWIDITHLWREHQGGEKNHGQALMLLAALEISLKAIPTASRDDTLNSTPASALEPLPSSRC